MNLQPKHDPKMWGPFYMREDGKRAVWCGCCEQEILVPGPDEKICRDCGKYWKDGNPGCECPSQHQHDHWPAGFIGYCGWVSEIQDGRGLDPRGGPPNSPARPK